MIVISLVVLLWFIFGFVNMLVLSVWVVCLMSLWFVFVRMRSVVWLLCGCGLCVISLLWMRCFVVFVIVVGCIWSWVIMFDNGRLLVWLKVSRCSIL